MEDRLLEFQQLSRVPHKHVLQSDEDEREPGNFLPKFNAKSKLLQQAINQIKYNNQQILREKEVHKYATLGEVEKSVSDKINKLIEQNRVLSLTVKEELFKMQNDIEETRSEIKEKRRKIMERLKKNIPESDEPELRMKIITFESLSSKFSDVLKETQSIQLDFKATVKDKLARQARIFNQQLSEAEIEEIINDPEGMEKLIGGLFVGPGAHTQVQNAISDIQDKYRDILNLERSVTMMHEMFIDMALLVHANGQTLNSVQGHVNAASHFVKLAVGELGDAKKKEKSAKKWKIFGCAFVIIILIIILWPVLHLI